MALHGPIQVNAEMVGYWSAQRIRTGGDGVNRYRCDVTWTSEDQTWHQHRFEIEHQYRDGAVALAAKVLTRAVELADTEGGAEHD